MKQRTDWKILRYVAEHSPKKYAEQIEQRCEETLRALRRLNTLSLRRSLTQVVPLGCPHCCIPNGKGCQGCVWWAAGGAKYGYEPCTSVKFRGIDWFMAAKAGVVLKPDYVQIEGPFNARNWNKVTRFLEGHIEWARKPWWGKWGKKV